MPVKVTPENKDRIRKALFGDREYLFDMPTPANPPGLSALEKIQVFRSLADSHGGLFRFPDAAEILGLSYSTIKSYTATGVLESVEFFGTRWVTGNALEKRLKSPRKSGRPRHAERV